MFKNFSQSNIVNRDRYSPCRSRTEKETENAVQKGKGDSV